MTTLEHCRFLPTEPVVYTRILGPRTATKWLGQEIGLADLPVGSAGFGNELEIEDVIGGRGLV